MAHRDSVMLTDCWLFWEWTPVSSTSITALLVFVIVNFGALIFNNDRLFGTGCTGIWENDVTVCLENFHCFQCLFKLHLFLHATAQSLSLALKGTTPLLSLQLSLDKPNSYAASLCHEESKTDRVAVRYDLSHSDSSRSCRCHRITFVCDAILNKTAKSCFVGRPVIIGTASNVLFKWSTSRYRSWM